MSELHARNNTLCCVFQTSKWGRTILFLVGFGLIVYGLYCVCVAFFARQFPTPGPTESELMQLRQKKAEKAAKAAKWAARKAVPTAGLSENPDDVAPSGAHARTINPDDVA